MPTASEIAVTHPYPGLRPFEQEEDYLFFGREQQTDELLRTLRQTRFVAVVGSSGSGKSSMVRAGLVPSLYGGAMAGTGSTWRVAILRPGDKPITNLAQALYDAAGLGKAHGSRDVDLAVLETTLRSSSAGLAAVFREAHLGDQENLLVVADQFEELFRYRSTETGYAETAAEFVKLLLGAAADPSVRIYVVMTIRSDFIGNCAEFPGLPKAVSDGQFLVPRMSRGELRRAITGPAGVAGGEVAPRLVVRLLNEAGDDPDQLPVLQHALMRSWDSWRQHRSGSEPLDIADYEAIGTMTSALSRHAEEAYNELTSDADRAIAEKTFRALMETDEKGRLVRRPSTIEEIAGIADAREEGVRSVIEHFRAPGRSFLVLRPDSFLDLSHESLMRIWDRLAQWAKDEAEAAALYRRITQAAELHARDQESLWVNPQLAFALDWREKFRPTAAWAGRYGGNFSRAMEFLETSRKAVTRQQRLKIAAVASIVLLLMGVFAVYAAMKAKENHDLEKSNDFLQKQLDKQGTEHSSLQKEVASLRARQAQLTQSIAALTEQMKQNVTTIGGLKKDSDALAAQVQTAQYYQNFALEKINRAVSSNDQFLTGLPGKIKSISQSLNDLGKLNGKNRELFIKMIELGVPMPRLPPIAVVSPVVPALALPPLKAKPPSFVASPDAYLAQLLQRNAELLAQAQQLARANLALQREATLLREQNEKLLELTADLREQAARLDGEIRLLSSVNELRKKQYADDQSFTAKLDDLNSRLSSEFMEFQSVNAGLDGLSEMIGMQMEVVIPINDTLSKAIQDFQNRK
jgi:energy-coupling factor transporter ATP-binding protein EcfA2